MLRRSLGLTAAALAIGAREALRLPEAPVASDVDGTALLEANASVSAGEAFPFYKLGALATPFVGRSGVQDRQRHDQLQAPHRSGAGPLSALLDPMWEPKLLVYVKFVKVKEDDGEVDLVLPAEWADNLDPNNDVTLLHRSWHSSQRHKASVYQATSKHAPHHELVIKVTDAADHQSEREMMVRHQISYLAGQGGIDSWGIMPCYESRKNSRQSYYLMPKADGDLQGHLKNRRLEVTMRQRERAEEASSQSDEATQKTPQQELAVPLPMEEALTMTIDLLHGVQSLHKAGVIDGDLSPENVLIKDGRAFITDFGRSGFLDSDEKGSSDEEASPSDPVRQLNEKLGMAGLIDREASEGDFMGSAYRSAPEMTQGLAGGADQSVWGVGLLFAEMVLGRCPTVMEPPIEGLDLDQNTEGREEIRRRIRDDFSIADAEGFSKLPLRLQKILQGMLERDPAERLEIAAALAMLEEFAASVGFELPRVPAWPDLSEQWHVQLRA